MAATTASRRLAQEMLELGEDLLDRIKIGRVFGEEEESGASRGSRGGRVWWRIFEAMSDDPDFEYLIVDSTIVRAHQHAAGAKKKGLKIKRSAARAAA